MQYWALSPLQSTLNDCPLELGNKHYGTDRHGQYECVTTVLQAILRDVTVLLQERCDLIDIEHTVELHSQCQYQDGATKRSCGLTLSFHLRYAKMSVM